MLREDELPTRTEVPNLLYQHPTPISLAYLLSLPSTNPFPPTSPQNPPIIPNTRQKMRLPLTPPQKLSPAQLPLYTSMQSTISSSFNNFISSTPDGALLGPWGVWIQQPIIGAQVWELVKSMTVSAKLPQKVRQIVILCVGARYKAQYEIYAHGSMARADGMEERVITTLVCYRLGVGFWNGMLHQLFENLVDHKLLGYWGSPCWS